MAQQYRWITAALVGRWCSSPEEALYDALRAGQASTAPEQSGRIVLCPFATIENVEDMYAVDVPILFSTATKPHLWDSEPSS